MIFATAFQVVASAAIASLATACVRNMLETSRISRVTEEVSSGAEQIVLPEEACVSSEALVEHLQSLSRAELLRIFLQSLPPTDADDIRGEWNGVLLNNNSLGMTVIGSKLMSNVLFGKGRRWNGKTFGSKGRGINRFHHRGETGAVKEHSFNYAIKESEIDSSRKSSICLDYSQYQSAFSLWRTMKDEVRCLPQGGVLIGFGSMAWSGGFLNAAPFCLSPVDDNHPPPPNLN